MLLRASADRATRPRLLLLRRFLALLAVGIAHFTLLWNGDGRFTLVAGLFLLGSTLVRYGVIGRIEQSTRGTALVGLAFAAAAAPALWWQSGLDTTDREFPTALALAGLLLAGSTCAASCSCCEPRSGRLSRRCSHRSTGWRWATWAHRPPLRRAELSQPAVQGRVHR